MGREDLIQEGGRKSKQRVRGKVQTRLRMFEKILKE